MKIDQVRVVNSNNLTKAQRHNGCCCCNYCTIFGKIIVSKQNNNVGLFNINFSCKKNIYVHSNKFPKKKHIKN